MGPISQILRESLTEHVDHPGELRSKALPEALSVIMGLEPACAPIPFAAGHRARTRSNRLASE